MPPPHQQVEDEVRTTPTRSCPGMAGSEVFQGVMAGRVWEGCKMGFQLTCSGISGA